MGWGRFAAGGCVSLSNFLHKKKKKKKNSVFPLSFPSLSIVLLSPFFSSVLPVGSQRPQPQRLQLDEPGRVLLVVRARVVLEGGDLVVVERVGGLAPDDDDVALVELDADRPLDELLRRVDGGLEGLALGREPEAVVDELGVAGPQLVLEVGLLLVLLFFFLGGGRERERETEKEK